MQDKSWQALVDAIFLAALAIVSGLTLPLSAASDDAAAEHEGNRPACDSI